MNSSNPFILALCISRNAQETLPFMLNSISWVSKIVYVDDHSTDNSLETVHSFLLENDNLIDLQKNKEENNLLTYQNGKRDVANEMRIRNYWINYCFRNYTPDALLLIDSDEIMSCKLKEKIVRYLGTNITSIGLECNHILSKDYRLNVYNQYWNDVMLIDPHVRVLFKKRQYIPGQWVNSPDCFLNYDKNTICLSEPLHFHLHYLPQYKRKNYAFKHLPEYITIENSRPDCIPIPEDIPNDIKLLLSQIIK